MNRGVDVINLLALLLLSSASFASEVHIVDVKVECPSSCTFAVTLEHADQGWNHYANQWDVVTLDGQLLKSRVLYHPHDDEQPFTRSLSGVMIPQQIRQVKIRARDTVSGYSPQEFLVDLPR
jgi:hypothetical protein